MKYALILLAGYANRAEPFSRHVPKPLFPIGPKLAMDYAVEYCLNANLIPRFVTGNHYGMVERHIARQYPIYDIVRIQNPSSNLLESVLAGGEGLCSNDFVWMGSGMFFAHGNCVKELAAAHASGRSFCTLYSQTKRLYKPKLVLQEGRLVRFIVGEGETELSSPTLFAVSSDFIQYARNFGEFDVFQSAINAGEKFNVLELDTESIEIHDINDYYAVQQMLFPGGYQCDFSNVNNSEVLETYIYSSTVSNASVRKCIIIESDIKGNCLEGVLVYRNEILGELIDVNC